MLRFRVTARRKTDTGRGSARWTNAATGRKEDVPGPAAGRQGGRGTARRTNADNVGSGGCKEDRRPEAISQGTQHNETAERAVGGGTNE
jgi:hypothetical protein